MCNTGHWFLASDCGDKPCWIILGCFSETGCETSCLHQLKALSQLFTTDAVGQTKPQEMWLQKLKRGQTRSAPTRRYAVETKGRERDESEKEKKYHSRKYFQCYSYSLVFQLYIGDHVWAANSETPRPAESLWAIPARFLVNHTDALQEPLLVPG